MNVYVATVKQEAQKAPTRGRFDDLASGYDAGGPDSLARYGRRLVETVGARPRQRSITTSVIPGQQVARSSVSYTTIKCCLSCCLIVTVDEMT